MNYGYAGTRELNEALVSRFTVIRMPTLKEEQLRRLLLAGVPNAQETHVAGCVGLFLDLNEKAVNGEISTHPVDLRGMTAALRLMTDGMSPADAVALGITNKCFDEFEHRLVSDVVLTRLG
jgi:MoxR-like ATPase